jgi:hypothetical protein
MELAVGNLDFNGIKEFSNRRNSLWVANEYYFISQIFRLQVKMETTAIFIDDEF